MDDLVTIKIKVNTSELQDFVIMIGAQMNRHELVINAIDDVVNSDFINYNTSRKLDELRDLEHNELIKWTLLKEAFDKVS